MTSGRGKDKPRVPPLPDEADPSEPAAKLLTSEDLFGEMLDTLDEGEARPAPPPTPASPAAPSRKGPIKVQVSEPGAPKKAATTPPPSAPEPLPDDLAALLDAFEPAEAEAPAPPSLTVKAAPRPELAAPSAPGPPSPPPEDVLQDILQDLAPPPAQWREVDEEAAERLIEPFLSAEEAEAAVADDDHAEALRDLLELRLPSRPEGPSPPPAHALPLAAPPPARAAPLPAPAAPPPPPAAPAVTGTRFQAAAPAPLGPGRSVDLAALAEEALGPASAPGPAPPPPAAAVPPPTAEERAYGPYRLLERLAMGGMAEVFKAKRTGVEGFEKVLAVKRILPHLSDNKEFVDMFIDEAKMVAGLSHPHIVQIFDLGKIEKSYYIAMEYVHGRDLRTILRRARERGLRLPLDLCILIVSRVCSALEFAHRKKDERGQPVMIVHRDVSPQNILISFEGDVKLADFGIAKAASKANVTDTGALRGKLLYMSPEQAWGKPIDRRADVFSLGIVLYEMLTDQRPFVGSSEMSILEMVRECRVAPPSILNPRIPPKLEKVVMKALEREPEQRYQDAAEMHRELERMLHEGQPPTSGALARFLEVLFDEEERSDAVRQWPPPERPAPAPPASSGLEVDLAEPPPPSPPPAPEKPAGKDPMSLQKLLRRFGLK